MPIYDYRCLVCRRQEIDRFVLGGESPELDCPECGAPMVRPLRPASIVIAGAYRAARDDGSLWASDHCSQLKEGNEASTRAVHYDVLRRSGFCRQRALEVSKQSASEGVIVTDRQADAIASETPEQRAIRRGVDRG